LGIKGRGGNAILLLVWPQPKRAEKATSTLSSHPALPCYSQQEDKNGVRNDTLTPENLCFNCAKRCAKTRVLSLLQEAAWPLSFNVKALLPDPGFIKHPFLRVDRHCYSIA
jgi:hypothetical protein